MDETGMVLNPCKNTLWRKFVSGGSGLNSFFLGVAFVSCLASMLSVYYILNFESHKNQDIHRVHNVTRKLTVIENDIVYLKELMEMLNNKTSGVKGISLTGTCESGPIRLCDEFKPNINDTMVLRNKSLSMEALENLHPEVKLGGSWEPAECTARHEIAIIIPYRDRDEHLRIFLRHMHPFLQKQQINYTIYVVELKNETAFNRGFLLNVGFVEALRDKNYPCFVLHDVDLLPENYQNIYTCSHRPRLMAVTRSQTAYRHAYKTYMGGVLSIPKSQFQIINGFSNNFYNWGGEDDDFYNRIVHHQLKVERLNPKIGRYYSVAHAKQSVNQNRLKIMNANKKSNFIEGLSTLRYRLLRTRKMKLYTWILTQPVDIIMNSSSTVQKND